jgi:hypothetical protein
MGCAYEPKEDAEGAAKVAASGWVKYDPENFWTDREFEVEMRSPMPRTTTASAVFTYDFGMAKIPLLRKIELVRKERSKGYDREEIQGFEWDAAIPEETEFTLPAFGIDEPEKVMKP